ncbi:bifunctional phosphoribosylaminoimidazolecarboxamide formyltransferase/IMP cyclohydrolase [Pelagibacteraceae bacterium]|jgi:phosphoribosylaminoimidazolecarboxamide formyltransferase / IMP cyclohydrolase|nr:bifunctional phosphoribosylaminoimidazolecarboxamide formyltransferase/IMP cyclohydrolase [Pelagibacteraceae bacterium]MDC1158395.1 bifunctional phosphoribosylaminoimidazolecarboxamide formyltransferase/IMP cyclohydrolase [Pelagibacteraceae bacterium]
MNLKVKNALISVSNKENLTSLLKTLKKFNIKIISSGGTYTSIIKLGYQCTELSKYTGFKEMLDGRVKTLHPKIHAGILHDRQNKKHKSEMFKKKFPSIDLIVVNFYPFQKVVTNSNNPQKIIENIDIGGPTMVRAAAKNFKNVAIITNKNDYGSLINELENFNGKTTLKFRELMSSKAFGLTAYYDAMIANWFNKKLSIKFPERKTIFGRKLHNLRYGENPHQQSAIYVSDYNDKELGFIQIHGKKLSYNNYNDMFASLEILNSLKKNSGTVIIKHANPCGVSENKMPLISFKNAFASDPISAFGGVIACNYKINKKIALEINKNFLEVILAKSFDEESLKILKRKKNLRIIDISKFKLKNLIAIKPFDRSFLLQSKDNIIINKKKLNCVTKLKPNRKELAEIEFAFNICKHVKSNAIVLCNNFSTIGIGAGQPSRLDSCKIAVQKAKQFQPSKIKNSIASSDAFFPFTDGINTLIKAGVKIIVQPGGSIRDQEIINAADKAKIKMFFTGIRHFNH